jgi:hypothetical protein
MNKIIKLLLLTFISTLFVGCASTLKPQELQSVRTVGVINNFPATPNFVTIGTTIFNNEYARIDDPQFSSTLTNTVINYISSKGYKVALIKEDQKSDFDMVIELIPRDVYSVPGTFGFGVNQRSMFGNAMQANTYVALNISPSIKGVDKCNACYLQKLIPIDIDNLPPAWKDLTEQQKSHIAEVLNNNIKASLEELLIQVGI